jgi:hypothetical protein
MHTTGWKGDWRWSGEHRVPPDDPDYRMWCRFAEAFRASPPLFPFVSSDQLPAVRADFSARIPMRPETINESVE